MMIKPATAWALSSFRSEIIPGSVRSRRSQAIEYLIGDKPDQGRMGPAGRWRYWYNRGFRVIKVNVTAARP